MSDDIPDDMQRLIAEAVASGKVTKVRQGESGTLTYRRSAGRPRDHATIKRVELLSKQKLSDGEIAQEIGKSRKAVSNCRYRHGIENGFVARRK